MISVEHPKRGMPVGFDVSRVLNDSEPVTLLSVHGGYLII